VVLLLTPLTNDGFSFLDNNLGGSPRYLRELCEALMPLEKIWGCALTFNVLRDAELVRLMGRAGCRYVQRLSRALGSLRNVGRHVWSRLMTSDLPRYKACVVMSAPEVMSLRAPLANRSRSYIAGRDPIEAWDAARMQELGLEPQRIDASSCRADARGLARIRPRRSCRSSAVA
jgi:hypothetical protein